MITLLANAMLATTAAMPDLVVATGKTGTMIRYADGLGVRSTRSRVSSARTLHVPGSPVRIALWNEKARGISTPYYAISLDGRTMNRVTSTNYQIELQYGAFDPLKSQPTVLPELASGPENELFIVQFQVQPLQEFRDGIQAAGGSIKSYLTNHAYLVRMDSEAKSRVAGLPFVRAVVPYHPAYRTDAALRAKIEAGNLPSEHLYNIQVQDDSESTMSDVSSFIGMIGGEVTRAIPENSFLTARLTPEQFMQVIRSNDLSFIDLWGAPEDDMTLLRTVHGVDYVNTFGVFDGTNFRGAVMDGGCVPNHIAWATRPPILQTANSNVAHGTACYGVNFGDGTGNAAGIGILPRGQGIFAAYSNFLSGGGDRNALTANILANQGCYQTNSWGDPQVTTYTTISAQMDSILFNNDITIFQSQSNTGSTSSRPQAWAKNMVSVGGAYHFNNSNFDDDRWNSGASTGPAADGRIKPDLCNAYDQGTTTYTTSTTGYSSFSGTSQATPITSGLFGVMFQIWGQGFFGNPCLNSSYFANRPKASLAKALMINTARMYGTVNVDLTRTRQGWGTANLKNLWDLRNNMMLVNESDVLQNLQTKTYRLYTAAGTPNLKVTMVYTDPAGTVGAAMARKNNLSLKVTSPSGVVYWGNNGMGTTSNVTIAGGAENNVDTVENVFLAAPETGAWTVQVIGSDINTDARPETSGVVDADFALVASGVTYSLAPTGMTAQQGSLVGGNMADLSRSENVNVLLGEPLNVDQIGSSRSVLLTAVSPVAALSQIGFQIESRTGRPQGAMHVEAFNFSTNSWSSFGTFASATADSCVTPSTTVSPSSYVNPTTREMRLRLTFSDADLSAEALWNAVLDQVRFLVNP